MKKKYFQLLMIALVMVPVLIFLAACGGSPEVDKGTGDIANGNYVYSSFSVNGSTVSMPVLSAKPVMAEFTAQEPDYYWIYDTSLFNKSIWITEYKSSNGATETEAQEAYTNAVGEVITNYVSAFKSDNSNATTEEALAAYELTLIEVKDYQKIYDAYELYLYGDSSIKGFYDIYDEWKEESIEKIKAALINAGVRKSVAGCLAKDVLKAVPYVQDSKIVIKDDIFKLIGNKFFYSNEYIVNNEGQVIFNGEILFCNPEPNITYSNSQISINLNYDCEKISILYKV